MIKKPLVILVVMVLASLCLRLWQLGSIPLILNRDEAALAYNAKLLKETGKDEWGRAWPPTLESFGDYKLPGYTLTLIPLFSVFGYHDWVVKLPSVLAGTFIIPVIYFFAKTLGWSTQRSLIASFVVATTPVFFFYSRVAFEANLALLLLLTSLILLLRKSTNRRKITDLLAVLLFLLAVFTYNTPLLLLPFIVIAIPLWRGLKNWRSWWTPTAGLMLVLLIGGVQLLSLSERKSGITIFQDELTWLRSVEQYQQLSGWKRAVFGNKVVFYSTLIANNYLKTLSTTFLVKGEGGHPWHSVANQGHILSLTYILFLVGVGIALYSLVSKGVFKQKTLLLLGYLFFVSLLPAAITVDAPHATRSLLFFIIICMYATIGLDTVQKRVLKHSILNATIFVLCISLYSKYLHNYFTVFPSPQAEASLKPGFDEIIKQANTQYPQQQIAIVDDEGFHYIVTAWYLNTPASEFFSTVVRQQPDRIGFRYGERLGRFHFIARKEDRFSNERVMIEWTKNKRWELSTY